MSTNKNNAWLAENSERGFQVGRERKHVMEVTQNNEEHWQVLGMPEGTLLAGQIKLVCALFIAVGCLFEHFSEVGIN